MNFAHELQRSRLKVGQLRKLQICDEDGAVLGEHHVDLDVDARLIVEVKPCRAIEDADIGQMLGFSRSNRIAHGALVNFGGTRWQI